MARILAVDDSDQNLITIELFLKGGEFELVTATSGRDALDLASKQEFDLILLDVMMPGIDGFEVCRRLKNDPRTAFTPVIFLTARMRDESDRMQAFAMGAVDYIQKPVNKEELVARIRVMLRLVGSRSLVERENAQLRAQLGQSEQALGAALQAGALLQALVESYARQSGRGVVLLDKHRAVLGIDPVAAAWLGEAQPGTQLAAAGLLGARLQRLLDDGVASAELALPLPEGARSLRVQLTTLPPNGVVAVQLRDITEVRAAEQQVLARTVTPVAPPPSPALAYSISGFVGASACVREVASMVDRLRQGRATVLVQGESGTGKELVARALHFDGPARHRPFIPIHCGAISPELIESELFGYEKGAFTGALTSREGLFSVADGGTIFLDEIAETSVGLQVKLLRVLQMGEIRPVGANQPRIVDVRILAATNRDLLAMVRDGRFREDLYFRLEVVALPLPPLRARPEDIPLLCEHFVARFNQRYGREQNPVRGVSRAAMARLLAYPWPGNVRELENVLDRAFALGVGELVQEEDLTPHVISGTPVLGEPGVGTAAAVATTPLVDLRTARQQTERAAILQALERNGGDKLAAARTLGLTRSTFYRRLRELGM